MAQNASSRPCRCCYLPARLQQTGESSPIVAISDSKGGVYSPNGFDVASIHEEKQCTRVARAVYCEQSVCGLVEHDAITNEDLLKFNVDILIPAAFNRVWDLAEVRAFSLRSAAYAVAIRRIGEAVEAHGTRDYFSS